MGLEEILLPTKESITGLILAGGKGKRFNGQDKGLIPFKGSTLIEHAISRIAPHVKEIIISANRNTEFYRNLDVCCLADDIGGFSGPLAGIHAALKHIKTDWLISIACDTPYFPKQYVEKLSEAIKNSNCKLAVAQTNNQLQNVFMLVHNSLYESLDNFLKNGERKAQIWIEQNNPVIVDFNKTEKAFFNINTPEDLKELEKLNSNE